MLDALRPSGTEDGLPSPYLLGLNLMHNGAVDKGDDEIQRAGRLCSFDRNAIVADGARPATPGAWTQLRHNLALPHPDYIEATHLQRIRKGIPRQTDKSNQE